MGELLFFHFRVANVKLINKKKHYYNSNVHERLEMDNTPCLEVSQLYSKVGLTWMWSLMDRNLSGFCLGATSLLVPETFKSKVLII